MHPLSHNCDLWILPPPRRSTWFSRIDWYLNWQMCKALSYPGLHLPLETVRLAQEFETELDTSSKPQSLPLMVITAGLVPAKNCVVLELTDLKDWLTQACATAEKLKAQKVRIFLPADIEADQAHKMWPKKFTGEVIFSPDKEALQ